jgi:hypothetical protein
MPLRETPEAGLSRFGPSDGNLRSAIIDDRNRLQEEVAALELLGRDRDALLGATGRSPVTPRAAGTRTGCVLSCECISSL